MPKQRITITIDERVLRAVRVKAAWTGRRDSDVIKRRFVATSDSTFSTASGKERISTKPKL